MRIKSTPKALALIPDGNRRWSKRHRLPFFLGYRHGVEKFIDFADWCMDYGVKNITVWAFSTENFRRPTPEREALFKLYKKAATDKKILSRLHANKTRFNVVGNKELLPDDLLKSLHNVELETAGYKDRSINMLIAYGGVDDLLHATKMLVKAAIKKGVRTVNEALFRAYLISNQVPDIDLVIRTSGEERLSGFMPLQTGYSELYFTKKYWPDFTRKDLEKALAEYDRRQRRFGA